MKQKFSLLGAYLISLLLVCTCVIGMCTACDSFKGDDSKAPAAIDSALVSQCIYDYFNPEFTSVEEVLDFQYGIQEDAEIDSFMGTISPDKLSNIASVLFKRGERVTIRTLLREYQCNKDVYDNLPISNTPARDSIKTDNKAMEEPPTGVGKNSTKQRSINYKDTTIDGKKCLIETKISEYE